jgi:hypothetical protein
LWLGARGIVDLRHRADELDDVDRRDDVVADAAPDELAIEDHVVHVADHDHLGTGVTVLGEHIEGVKQLLPLAGRELQHDEVRGRRLAVGLDGGRRAAHLDLEMRLVHAPVDGRRLDGGGDVGGFAERLDGDPRDGSDVADRLGLRRRGGTRGGVGARHLSWSPRPG